MSNLQHSPVDTQLTKTVGLELSLVSFARHHQNQDFSRCSMKLTAYNVIGGNFPSSAVALSHRATRPDYHESSPHPRPRHVELAFVPQTLDQLTSTDVFQSTRRKSLIERPHQSEFGQDAGVLFFSHVYTRGPSSFTQRSRATTLMDPAIYRTSTMRAL